VATDGGSAQGADNNFTTAVPVAVTEPAIEVGMTNAKLWAAVNPQGFTVTDCHFEWGTSAAYGSTATCAPTPSGSALQAVSAALTGLTAATTYHYRIVMKTSYGTAMGGDASFTTVGPYAPPPVALTQPATGVTASAATLNGWVNPEGLPVSDCHFVWGTTTAYGSTARCSSTPSGTTLQAVKAQLAGLRAATLYHFRIVVATGGGTLSGGDATFTTSSTAKKKPKKKKKKPKLGKPGVKIAKASIDRRRHIAGFRFTYKGSKATSYQCSIAILKANGTVLARTRYARCTSPKSYFLAATATFVFYVRGHNSRGWGSPASYKFRM
jgi:hypothetical protein